MLVCGSAGYGWLYTPVESSILDAEMQIDELALSRQNADAIRREHDRLSSRLEDIGARYAALQRRVPENAEAGSFLKDVSEIAHEENLTISNFQPAKSVEGDGFTAMEVMLEGKGTFDEHLLVFRSAVKDSTLVESERLVCCGRPAVRRPIR